MRSFFCVNGLPGKKSLKYPPRGIQVQSKSILILNPICDKFWFVGGENFSKVASHLGDYDAFVVYLTLF